MSDVSIHPATIRRIADQLAAVSSREVSPAIYQSAMQHAADELRELIGEQWPAFLAKHVEQVAS